jgi:hypothetical protein
MDDVRAVAICYSMRQNNKVRCCDVAEIRGYATRVAKLSPFCSGPEPAMPRFSFRRAFRYETQKTCVGPTTQYRRSREPPPSSGCELLPPASNSSFA